MHSVFGEDRRKRDKNYGKDCLKKANERKTIDLRYFLDHLKTSSNLMNTCHSGLCSNDKIAICSVKDLLSDNLCPSDDEYLPPWNAELKKNRPACTRPEDDEVLKKIESEIRDYLRYLEMRKKELIGEAENYHLDLFAIAKAHNTRLALIENAPRGFLRVSLILAGMLLVLVHLDKGSWLLWFLKWGFSFLVLLVCQEKMSLLRRFPVVPNPKRESQQHIS